MDNNGTVALLTTDRNENIMVGLYALSTGLTIHNSVTLPGPGGEMAVNKRGQLVVLIHGPKGFLLAFGEVLDAARLRDKDWQKQIGTTALAQPSLLSS